MAAVWSSRDADDILGSSYAEQSTRPEFSSGPRKRGRGPESNSQGEYPAGSCSRCDADQRLRRLPSTATPECVANAGYCPVMERNFSFEVSALRAAAAAAVAEFTGPLGPGLQLTSSAKGDDLERQQPDPTSSPPEPLRGSYADSERSAQTLGTHVSSVRDGTELSEPATFQHAADGEVYTQRGCPPHGAKAICGRRPRMEDAYTAVPFLLEVPVPAAGVGQPDILPPRIAPQVRSSASGSPNSSDAEGTREADPTAARVESHSQASSSAGGPASTEHGPYMETLHFFGVFDGHGGAEAALHCAQTLHQRIAEALAAATEPMPVGSTGLAEDGDIPLTGPSEVVTFPDGRSAVLRPVNRPSEDEFSADADDLNEQLMEDAPAEAMPAADGVACSSASFESALTSAFNRTDEEFGKADNAALVGTTAVVTLVGSRQLYVANCGDSRAVLCRAGQAIPLTDDHKAAREDETARVEAAGGQILFWNGVRVMGVLAVSRAIGDHCLRPYVIAQPEVTILARRPDDELLLLASDGLWDVLSNQEACTLAKRCLRRARQRHASRQSAARIAATVLTRAAVDRGSRDNVTVLVVDLSNGAAGAAESDAAPLDRGSSTMLGDEVAQGEQDADEGLTSARSQGLPPRA